MTASLGCTNTRSQIILYLNIFMVISTTWLIKENYHEFSLFFFINYLHNAAEKGAKESILFKANVQNLNCEIIFFSLTFLKLS